MLVDPLELDLELLGGERERAEHAQTPGAAHGGDDVATVTECEDRDVDPEEITYPRPHLLAPLYETLNVPDSASLFAQG